MGEFSAVVKDVRANKGAMISSSGFTKAAINFAKTHGIDTFRLVDTESLYWKAYASIPALLERKFIKAFRLKSRSPLAISKRIETTDPKKLKVFSSDGNLIGNIHDIIATKWNNEEIDDTPGEKEILIGKNILLEVDNQKILLPLYIIVLVAKEYFFGNLSVHLKGFKNEQEGSVITREIITDSIEPYKIEQGLSQDWRKIENPDELSVKWVIATEYKDVIPTSRKGGRR